MPIHEENNQSQGQASQGAAAPQANTQQQPNQPSWTFGTGLFAAPIARGVGSEYYAKLKTALFEVYKQTDPSVEIQLLDLDNVNEPSLVFSALIVATRNKLRLETGVAFHVLLLEATGEKIPPYFENYNGSQVEVYRVPSDAFDKELIDRALVRVQRAYPNARAFMVDGVVVPASFNPDNKYAVHSLALNAGLATNTELVIRSKDFQDFNLARRQQDNNLNINIGFNRVQVENAVGEPMRSDVMIAFNSNRNNNQRNNQMVNSGDREVQISRISGFVDLLRVPPPNMQANSSMYGNYYTPQQQGPKQIFAPRLVITNLESTVSYTPASVVLSLATALSLNDNFNWMQAFRPQPTGRNEIDLTDIGALNIDANTMNDPSGFGVRVDTKDNSFQLENLGQLISMMIQPGLIVSLDCPEFGPQSWYLSVFALAANGNTHAYDAVYAAAEELTNGNFGKAFPKGQPMFVDAGNRIHLGTWTDRNGNKRDIRDIDHLAVCNLVGERDAPVIRDWSNTFLNLQQPLLQRLAIRKKLISGLTGDTATFTGFAQRITFTQGFLSALQRGIAACGTTVNVTTPLNSSAFNDQRGVATFANSAMVMPGGQGFTQQAGFRNFNNPAFMGNMGFSRY